MKSAENEDVGSRNTLREFLAITSAKVQEYHPFHLSKEDEIGIHTFAGRLQSVAGLFNPHEGFAEGRSIPFLYAYLNQVANDLIQYEKLSFYLNKPGFLLTGIRPTFDIYAAGKEPRSVFPVNIGLDSYLCLGEENVKAGVQLQELLLRMKNLHGFEASIAMLKDVADESDEGTRKSIQQLTEAKDFFTKLERILSEQITNHAGGRKKLFIDKVLGQKKERRLGLGR